MHKRATTFQDVLGTHAKWTAAVPGVFPESMTGTLPTTVINGLLGAGLGRYVATPIASMLFPELNRRKLRRALTLGGAAALGLPAWYESSRRDGLINKTEPAPQPERNIPVWRAAREADQPQLDELRRQEAQTYGRGEEANADKLRQQQEAYRPVGLKKADYMGIPTVQPAFIQPSIPYGTASATLRTALVNGTLTPIQYASLQSMANEANRNRPSGLFSPSSLASAAVSYGLGHVTGAALGLVGGAVLGLKPGTQQTLAKGFGLGNVVMDLMGRLAT